MTTPPETPLSLFEQAAIDHRHAKAVHPDACDCMFGFCRKRANCWIDMLIADAPAAVAGRDPAGGAT